MKRKQFVVIGLGRFGSSVARTLSSIGHEVLAIDKDEHAVNEIAQDVTHALATDAREEATLKSLGIRNFDVAVVAIGDSIESNILISAILKDLGVKYIVAKAQSAQHGKILEKIGVDNVVYPERDTGIRVANSLVKSNLMDFIELSRDYSIMEIIVPLKFLNKTLGELRLRNKYGATIIAIKRGEQVEVNPDANSVLKEEDILVIIGDSKQLLRVTSE